MAIQGDVFVFFCHPTFFHQKNVGLGLCAYSTLKSKSVSIIPIALHLVGDDQAPPRHHVTDY
jgi:hypothetical protein